MGMNKVCINANIHLHVIYTSESTYRIFDLAALQNIYKLRKKRLVNLDILNIIRL